MRKDLRLFFSDRRAVMMSMVAPILIGSFFGYIFGGRSGRSQTSKITAAVVDSDSSPVSRGVAERLASSGILEVRSTTEAEARERLSHGKITVAFLIPAGFGDQAGRAFFSGVAKPQITVLFDPTHEVELGIAHGVLNDAVISTVSREMFGGSTGRRIVDDTLNRMGELDGIDPARKKVLGDVLRSVRELNRDTPAGFSAGLNMPFGVREFSVTSPENVPYNGYAHSFAGMSVQFILFVGIDVGIGMLTLRQRGLWKRLRAAPLSRTMLLGSRAFSATLTSMLVLTVIFSFARFAFGVRIAGSMLGFIGVCVAFSFMTAAFGLLIAAVGKTPEAARGLSILVTLLLVMLGGAWVPAFIFPQWLQTITLFVPTRWAVDGLDAMTWRGLGLSAALGPIAVLLLSSLVFGALAVSRFRWEIDG